MNGFDRRDQQVDRLLQQSLGIPGATDACLDAEAVAAWLDGGLSGTALQSAETHVAACPRCQAIVGTLVRTELSAQPEPTSWRWLGWLVPLTAAAAAVVLWVVVPRDARVTTPEQTSARFESADQIAPTHETMRRDAEQPTADRNQRARTPQGLAAQKSAPRSEARAPAPERLERPSADAIAVAPPIGRAASSPAGAAPPPPPPALNETIAISRSGALVSGTGPIVASPDPAVRWRLSGRMLERSDNGGSSWETVFAAAGALLTAGAAPSTSVCWIVGRSGTVLRSTDGRNFSRVPFPDQVDLSAVVAADAMSATVTGIDGRFFATTDGGTTWASR